MLRVESVLLTVTHVSTLADDSLLTQATGFFFERDGRLFLVTSRHVCVDEATGHRPERIEIDIHVSEENIAETTPLPLALYDGEQPRFRQASDSGGVIDVVVLPIDPAELPERAVYRAFTPEHLVEILDEVEVGTPVLVVGFPLGFRDTLHRLPVARQAIIASAFGLRFQGTGCFLTDGRAHRGTSGGPVVTRVSNRRGRSTLPFVLLGVHASRLDVGTRDQQQDEALGLNCAWYADVLMRLTAPDPVEPLEDSPTPPAAELSPPQPV